MEIKADNKIVSNPVDIAETINKHFTHIAQVLAEGVPSVDVNPEIYLETTDKSFSLQTPGIDIVLNLLKKLDDKKATDLDKIPSKLLRMASGIIAPLFIAIFSNVYNQLYNYLNDNKLLLSCQSGFRSLHSTLTALLEATNDWSGNIDNGLLNGVIFIDLTNAFDTIDHEIILRKISFLGFDQVAIRWFLSYQSGRTQRCDVNGKLSTARDLRCDVPQGSILDSLLFLIYINDLPNCLRASARRMFADDTNIIH